MINSVLNKYTARRPDESTDGETEDGGQFDDLGAFGILRGTRDRALMLELRKKNGNIQAFGYAWLERIDFDPSEGITLHVTGRTIHIKGRNLNTEIRPNVRLFQCLTRHRVSWIQEADQPTTMESGGKGILVDSIEW